MDPVSLARYPREVPSSFPLATHRSARVSAPLALLGALALPLSIAGCFGPVDLANRRCPCEVGWTCDTARELCVPSGIDAAASDGGPRDAAARDASAPDTSAPDSGAPVDAWTPPGRDAATVDTSTPTPDAGVSYCPPGARVCDDFEQGAVSRQPPFDWGVDTVRSTARAHRGAASGLFEATAAGDQPDVGLDLAMPATEIWARFWLYVDAANVIDDSAIFFAGEGVAPYGSTSLLLNGSGLAIYASGGAGTYLSGIAMPRDRWVCVAIHLDIGVAGHVDVFADGVTAISDALDTSLPAGVNSIGLGITYTSSTQSTPLSYAFDDVAVTLDGTPLPCF